MKVAIEEGKEQLLIDLVKMAHSKFNKGTLTLTGINILRYKEIIYAISSLIEIDGYLNDSKKRNIIDSAVRNSKNYKRLTKSNFLRRIEVELKKLERKPLQTFWIVFPTNIVYNNTFNNRRSFVLNNARILIRNYSQITVLRKVTDRKYQFLLFLLESSKNLI